MTIEYNTAPEGLKEISLEEWTLGMFQYCLSPVESRQVRGDKTFDLRMFDVPNFDGAKLGYAIMNDWFDSIRMKNRNIVITRFCRYGNDDLWVRFKNQFASQFAHDNS